MATSRKHSPYIDTQKTSVHNNIYRTEEIQFQSIFESIPGLHLILKPDPPHFTILAASNAYIEATNTKREEILGKNLFEVFPDNPKDTEATGVLNLTLSLMEVLTTKSPHSMKIQKYDIPVRGEQEFEVRYWNPENRPILDTSGEVLYIIHSVTDVTQTILAEKRADSKDILNHQLQEAHKVLKKSEEHFQAIMKANSDAISLSDKNGKITAANSAYYNLYGYTEKEIIGKKFFITFPEDKRKHAQKQYNLLFRAKTISPPIENTVIRADGSKRIVESKYDFLYENNRRVAMVSSTRDITERKTIEEELRKSKAQIEAVFESIKDGVVVTDMQGNFLLINQAQISINKFESLEDMEKTFAAYKDLYSFWNLEGKEVPYNEWPLARILRGQSVVNTILKGKRNDIGKEWYFSFSGEPVKNEKNEQIMAVVITRDITDEKIAEEKLKVTQGEIKKLNQELEKRVLKRTAQLESSNKELQRSNKELEDFAYVASHDLQEPLRKITSFSNLLEKRYKSQLPPGAQIYINSMKKASERMNTLIKDLLTYSRVATQAQPFKEVSLDKITKEALNDLQFTIEQTSTQITTELLGNIEGDPLQLRLLFLNILSNAIKYKKENITPRISIYAKKQGEHINIYIEDNGIGFNEKYLNRIFTIFQRLHGKGVYEGTGIGLAICKKIVERHNGQITAKSKIGAGSTFIITLPVKQEEN